MTHRRIQPCSNVIWQSNSGCLVERSTEKEGQAADVGRVVYRNVRPEHPHRPAKTCSLFGILTIEIGCDVGKADSRVTRLEQHTGEVGA